MARQARPKHRPKARPSLGRSPGLGYPKAKPRAARLGPLSLTGACMDVYNFIVPL